MHHLLRFSTRQAQELLDITEQVRAAEISAEGKSIYAYDPKGKAAEAYRELTKEVLRIGQQREKAKSDIVR